MEILVSVRIYHFNNQIKNKTKPAEIRIISFKKEPKESIIKKPSRTSSKIKISLTIENCVTKDK